MTKPVNNQWLDELFAPLIDSPSLTLTTTYWNEARQAILSKLESIEQEAYKKGYLECAIAQAKIANKGKELLHE